MSPIASTAGCLYWWVGPLWCSQMPGESMRREPASRANSTALWTESSSLWMRTGNVHTSRGPTGLSPPPQRQRWANPAERPAGPAPHPAQPWGGSHRPEWRGSESGGSRAPRSTRTDTPPCRGPLTGSGEAPGGPWGGGKWLRWEPQPHRREDGDAPPPQAPLIVSLRPSVSFRRRKYSLPHHPQPLGKRRDRQLGTAIRLPACRSGTYSGRPGQRRVEAGLRDGRIPPLPASQRPPAAMATRTENPPLAAAGRPFRQSERERLGEGANQERGQPASRAGERQRRCRAQPSPLLPPWGRGGGLLRRAVELPRPVVAAAICGPGTAWRGGRKRRGCPGKGVSRGRGALRPSARLLVVLGACAHP